jgi:protein-disulfide isomerase
MTRLDRVLVTVTVMTLGLAVYVWARPGGVGGRMLERWRSQNAWEDAFESSKPDLSRVAYNSGAVQGTRIFEFFDYQCPYCRTVAHTIDVAEDSGFVSLSYLHYPLPNHPAARGGALASMCAADQGLFLEMHYRLLKTETWMADTNWTREATYVGVTDTAAFLGCMINPGTIARLDSSISLAQGLGITGTPAFVSSQGVKQGALPLETFKLLR